MWRAVWDTLTWQVDTEEAGVKPQTLAFAPSASFFIQTTTIIITIGFDDAILNI